MQRQPVVEPPQSACRIADQVGTLAVGVVEDGVEQSRIPHIGPVLVDDAHPPTVGELAVDDRQVAIGDLASGDQPHRTGQILGRERVTDPHLHRPRP